MIPTPPPPTLLSICLEYVASNIQLVDSFVGFPDTVGKMIFQEAATKGQFMNLKNSETAKSNLKVFFDAYSDGGILQSLGLRHCHLFVNDALVECTWILQNLFRLDLSFCGLGDSHELLLQIASIQSLEILNLQANCLSDVGIRRLTTPLRFHGKNHGLKYINLSSNGVTSRSLHFLKTFNRLCGVIVTDSLISIQAVHHEMGSIFSLHKSCLCWEDVCLVATDGWAKEVMTGWKEEYLVSRSNTGLPFATSSSPSMEWKPMARDAGSFYKKRRPLTAVSVIQPDQKDEAQEKVILVTDHFRCSQKHSGHASHRAVSPSQNSDRFNKCIGSHSLTVSSRQKHVCTTSLEGKSFIALPSPLPMMSSGGTCDEQKDAAKTVHSKSKSKRLCKRDDKEIRMKGPKCVGSDSRGRENSLNEQTKTKEKVVCPSEDFDSDDIFKFYAESHIFKAEGDSETGKSNKKSLLDNLQGWD